MKSFMWTLSSFSRRLGSKKSSKRRKRKLVVLSDDTTRSRHGKEIGFSASEFEDVKRHLDYDSDTPLINLKRLRKGVGKASAHNDDPGPSTVQTSYNEESGPSSNEGSDNDYSGGSIAVESDDDDSSVQPQKEKLSFFSNRRRRQLIAPKTMMRGIKVN